MLTTSTCLIRQSRFYEATATGAAKSADGRFRLPHTPQPLDHKLWKNAIEATHDIKDGATIVAGGFGLCGIPENLIKATAKWGVKDLTLISNECGSNEYGLSLLLKKKQVSKVYASYIGVNSVFE